MSVCAASNGCSTSTAYVENAPEKSNLDLSAEYEDAWECACGNRPDLDGFYPCDPTGREVEPDPGSDWDVKLLYCADYGLVMDQSTYDSTSQTVTVVERIKTTATSKRRNSRVYM